MDRFKRINRIKDQIRFAKCSSDVEMALKSAIKLRRDYKTDSQVLDLLNTVKALYDHLSSQEKLLSNQGSSL